MQAKTPEEIRNLAVVGHSDTGKTTLVSALLYASGVANRLNKVEDGNTVTDFDTEEIARGGSIGLAICYAPWKGHKINLFDCPGSGIFFTESKAGMRAADAALLCVNGVAGIEVVTENSWAFAERLELPVIIHLTKMDRERASFDRSLATMKELLDNAGTIVFVSHSLTNVEEFCDRAAWIDHGVVHAVGKSSDVVRSYRRSLRR